MTHDATRRPQSRFSAGVAIPIDMVDEQPIKMPKMPISMQPAPVDHPLYEIFMAAIEQAMFGKGERHGGARTAFHEQPWTHYVKMHGRGFLTGQAAKKLEEAASTREGLAFEQEMLGALVYIGMAILHERDQVNEDDK